MDRPGRGPRRHRRDRRDAPVFTTRLAPLLLTHNRKFSRAPPPRGPLTLTTLLLPPPPPPPHRRTSTTSPPPHKKNLRPAANPCRCLTCALARPLNTAPSG